MFKIFDVVFLFDHQGAQLIYEKFIKPFMVKYASKIDPIFARTEAVINGDQVNAMLKLAEKYGPEVADKAIKLVRSNPMNCSYFLHLF